VEPRRIACQLHRFGGGFVQLGMGHLHGEPFVHHQPVIFPLLIEGGVLGLPHLGAQQEAKGGELLGHVVGRLELLGRLRAAIKA